MIISDYLLHNKITTAIDEKQLALTGERVHAQRLKSI